MKKILLAIAILSLVGCASTPHGKETFPEVPKDMLTACPDLGTVDPTTTKLSDVVDSVTGNYQAYYSCKDNVDSWINWYNTQQKIFNSIK
jgi:type IV pilus biogenesis protein CpaD/CtpE